MKSFRVFFILALITLPALALGAETPGFVSLTKIPELEKAANASTLPDFLNYLYKICVGLAATLAILQIMRAGVMYTAGDSITEKKDAKNLIKMSLLGLLLVLAPYIVFTIINPQILELKVNVNGLKANTVYQQNQADQTQQIEGGTLVGGSYLQTGTFTTKTAYEAWASKCNSDGKHKYTATNFTAPAASFGGGGCTKLDPTKPQGVGTACVEWGGSCQRMETTTVYKDTSNQNALLEGFKDATNPLTLGLVGVIVNGVTGNANALDYANTSRTAADATIVDAFVSKCPAENGQILLDISPTSCPKDEDNIDCYTESFICKPLR